MAGAKINRAGLTWTSSGLAAWSAHRGAVRHANPAALGFPVRPDFDDRMWDEQFSVSKRPWKKDGKPWELRVMKHRPDIFPNNPDITFHASRQEAMDAVPNKEVA